MKTTLRCQFFLIFACYLGLMLPFFGEGRKGIRTNRRCFVLLYFWFSKQVHVCTPSSVSFLSTSGRTRSSSQQLHVCMIGSVFFLSTSGCSCSGAGWDQKKRLLKVVEGTRV